MGARDEALEQHGYPLDRMTPEGRLIEPVVIDNDVVYASGQVPMDCELLVYKGKVPSEVSMADATKAAALCAANILRSVRKSVGSLDNIERVIRITGYVNSDVDFTDQHLVMNGASQLVRDILGAQGRHARTALGMAQLPLGAAVEVEMILRRKGGQQ